MEIQNIVYFPTSDDDERLQNHIIKILYQIHRWCWWWTHDLFFRHLQLTLNKNCWYINVCIQLLYFEYISIYALFIHNVMHAIISLHTHVSHACKKTKKISLYWECVCVFVCVCICELQACRMSRSE